MPTISIITVVYNGEDTIQRTIDSIKNQSYKNIEYIIIDGLSKDNTVEIIKKNSEFVTKFISEPDNGLYDAMNKALEMATGDYVWFINSGDEIANSDVLSNVFTNSENADIYYGDTLIVDDNGEEIGKRRLQPPKELTWKDFKKGMVVSHQSIIIKRDITRKYDLNYRFSADFDWVLYALKKSKKNVNTQIVLSKFLDGGLTKQNIIPGLKERFSIMVKNFGLIPTIYQHIFISIKFFAFYVKYKRF